MNGCILAGNILMNENRYKEICVSSFPSLMFVHFLRIVFESSIKVAWIFPCQDAADACFNFLEEKECCKCVHVYFDQGTKIILTVKKIHTTIIQKLLLENYCDLNHSWIHPSVVTVGRKLNNASIFLKFISPEFL